MAEDVTRVDAVGGEGGGVLCLIPARYGSTRFPGKPLADATGRALIEHVVENAGRAKTVGRIVVATDDPGIFETVKGFGGEAVMTGADHPNGTSRLAEAVELLGDGSEVVLNIQGDEPEIEPGVIDALVEGLRGDAGASMATLYAPFGEGEDVGDANVVKVVKDRNDRALYFSRSVVPFVRGGGDGGAAGVTYYKHPGLYAYRRDFLLGYPRLEPTPLEEAEKLEQLRVLEHGYAIKLVRSPGAVHAGIDTPEQYAAFVSRWQMGAGG